MMNTLSSPRTGKLASLASALVYTGMSFAFATSTPVEAAGPAYYTAKLTAPAGESRVVAGGVAWTCEGEMCVANKAASRPLRVCRGLNRKFGEVVMFKVEGEEIAADELAKCNG
jgi:hypothetical protein